MQKESEARGFTIDRPFILSHEPYAGFFRYQIQSNLDPSDRWCDTVVWMDSDTGKFVIFWAPTGLNSGGTFSTWLKYLHFGWVGGQLYRIVIFVVGLLTAVLTATGVLIWWRKLRGRIRSTGVPYDRRSLLKLLSKYLAIATVVFLTCCVVTYFIFHNAQGR